jgi:glutamate---cysteine ligase / carboxylate-amine ligase
MKTPSFTLGIEEEYMTVDPVTRELRSHISAELIAKGNKKTNDLVKPEMHQSVIEVGTPVCRDIKGARTRVRDLRAEMISLAEEHGMCLAAGATHPFSHWKDQLIHPDERYQTIVRDLQLVARSNLIFGLHVHVGIEDRETIIHIMNSMRYFLPHILALSTNSPFWLGMNTGLRSYRCKVFDKFPRTNIPDVYNSWAEYESFINLLVKTNCIDNAKKIWWDIRPHPFFNTLEVRTCDIPMRLDETIALAALIQATMVKLYKLHEQNQTFRIYPRALIMENKWRAVRYGIEGKLIDFGKQVEVNERDLIVEYLAFVDDVLDELGSRNEVEYIYEILDKGTGADRQLQAYEHNPRMEAIVDLMVQETKIGVIEQQPTATSLPLAA